MIILAVVQRVEVFLKLKAHSHSQFLVRQPFKNDEKCFLFHLKSSYRSQDISVFV